MKMILRFHSIEFLDQKNNNELPKADPCNGINLFCKLYH